MLWPCSTVTSNVPDVGRRGWETIPVLRSLNARFVRGLHLKYNSWPPRPNVERGEQKKSTTETSSDATPTLVDPSEVTLLGRVNTDKPSSVESTPTKKKKRSDGSPKSSKRRHSSKPTSDDLKSLDDKWSERFSRLEALLLNKSFAVPVKHVKPSTVVTREHPFFDPGAFPVCYLLVWSLRVPVPVLYRPPVRLPSCLLPNLHWGFPVRRLCRMSVRELPALFRVLVPLM